MPDQELAYPLVELRRYRLRQGQRETLIALFDREFVETQEAAGMRVLGQFRDKDDAGSFVWLRAFADMESRARALQAFYTGPAWKAHGPAANATMINSDNVLLLRAPAVGHGFARPAEPRPAIGAKEEARGIYVATICALAPGKEEETAAFFDAELRLALEAAGARIEATFVTERQENSFPRLPVRAGEPVFLWFMSFADEAAYETYQARLAVDAEWQDRLFPALDRRLWRPLELAQLTPTARSAMRR